MTCQFQVFLEAGCQTFRSAALFSIWNSFFVETACFCQDLNKEKIQIPGTQISKENEEPEKKANVPEDIDEFYGRFDRDDDEDEEAIKNLQLLTFEVRRIGCFSSLSSTFSFLFQFF